MIDEALAYFLPVYRYSRFLHFADFAARLRVLIFRISLHDYYIGRAILADFLRHDIDAASISFHTAYALLLSIEDDM